MAKIIIKCDGVVCDNQLEFDASKLWWMKFDELEYGGNSYKLYCPNCSLQGEWFEDQCPGCVEGPKDCKLFQAFAWSDRRTITEKQLHDIEGGKCPYRTNGTFGFSRQEGFEIIDLSELATKESGLAIANAIRQYIKEYPSGN